MYFQSAKTPDLAKAQGRHPSIISTSVHYSAMSGWLCRDVLTRENRHPSSWNAKPQGTHDTPDIEAVEAVTMSIADKARFFSLIACTAAYREKIEEEDQRGRGAVYLGQALIAVREQIQRKKFVKKDSLYSLVNMAICAELLGDYTASLAHIRAAKFVVYEGGGLAALDLGTVCLPHQNWHCF